VNYFHTTDSLFALFNDSRRCKQALELCLHGFGADGAAQEDGAVGGEEQMAISGQPEQSEYDNKSSCAHV